MLDMHRWPRIKVFLHMRWSECFTAFRSKRRREGNWKHRPKIWSGVSVFKNPCFISKDESTVAMWVYLPLSLLLNEWQTASMKTILTGCAVSTFVLYRVGKPFTGWGAWRWGGRRGRTEFLPSSSTTQPESRRSSQALEVCLAKMKGKSGLMLRMK